ncbi:membrane protein [Mycobacterium rhizamassiliense]|jgi:hypothetical protein|uniref:Membrane protein n=1 Tax=Mycobacterium rhizamassiliense TaxID=1841860 RepID=A0A2U3NZV1_9MYCO|nr:DUF2567 domain-containing protein [Mycobacterium rhizamassiliense]SPM37016.1 membrane protein [Mycobacterium rhizamassiliense]
MTDQAGTVVAEPVGAPATPRGRATVLVVLGLLAAGVVVGGLWAWIAPPIHLVVAMTRGGERVHDYLGTESDHFFDVPCLMLGLLTILAVVTTVLVWQWRAHRGPGMVIGLSLGMLIAAGAASGVGAVLVRLRYGAVNVDAVALSGKPSVAYVVEAPPVFFGHGPLQIAATLVWAAAIAALVYAALAAGNARDDLGAFPPAGWQPQPLAVNPEAPEAAVS